MESYVSNGHEHLFLITLHALIEASTEPVAISRPKTTTKKLAIDLKFTSKTSVQLLCGMPMLLH